MNQDNLKNFKLNFNLKILALVSLSIWGSFLGTGCSSIKTPGFTSPLSHFNPIPNQIVPMEEMGDDEGGEGPSAPFGFFTPLDVKTEFDWPVDSARLTRGFLPYARPRPHLGLDLADRRGTPVLAAQDGLVIYAGSGFRGFGRFVVS